jgi:hypothetical protein
MYRLCVILLSSLLVSACIDRVELLIRSEEPRLVIDGQITNEAPPYRVRLTYTGKYGGVNGQNPDNQYVNGAQVSLADDQGRLTRFVSTGQGIYQTTDFGFRGQVGRTYSLTVVLSNGKRYATKPERMPAVPAIDSISAKLIKTGNFATPYAFSYGANTQDPATEKNYYRWTGYGITNRLSVGVPCSLGSPALCFNRCWTTVSNDAVNIYSDEAINGNPIRGRQIVQVPIYTIGPQLAEIQQYGITQTNYQFWKLYQQQNARTGSIFDPLPAPVTGNLLNTNDPADIARGYFAVTSITRRRIRVDNYDAPFYGALTSFIASQILPPGDCRNTYGPVPVTEPAGW